MKKVHKSLVACLRRSRGRQVRSVTRSEPEVAALDELDDLPPQGRVGIEEPRERAIQEALSQAGKWPSPGRIQRGWPVSFDVARTNRLIEKRRIFRPC